MLKENINFKVKGIVELHVERPLASSARPWVQSPVLSYMEERMDVKLDLGRKNLESSRLSLSLNTVAGERQCWWRRWEVEIKKNNNKITNKQNNW